jgi:hypothetical protein
MSPELITTLVTITGGLAASAASYYFTKRQEREADWRREKLVYYKAFAASLSGVVGGDATPEGQRAFALACNNLLLFAPQSVIAALRLFQDEIRISNPSPDRQKHDLLLKQLFLEIRKDIGVSPPDSPDIFQASLWASGVSPADRQQE